MGIHKNTNKYIISCEEIYINICQYAYSGGNGKVDIKCGYIPSDKELFVEFIDSGIEFDPTNTEHKKVNLPLNKREPGGLGIFMCKKLSDSVKYKRIGNKNILRIINFV